MRQVRVESAQVRKGALAVQPDQPMRWARFTATSEMMYVGWLKANQNGNACGCKCSACGEDLQAVNTGKDASHFLKANSRGMFFRHPSGHQRKDCSFLVAKLAALRLLMERDEIDLPPPRRAQKHQGASGAIYAGNAIGRDFCGRITNKVWVDNQSARITVDGRTVLVQLQARPDFSSDTALDGVIIIRVDDPIVASWEPSQILQALKIDSGFACWEKHWDDDELDAEAQRIAIAAADEAMDYLPAELGTLDGLTNFQKSESILHAKVKDILLRAGRLRVPSCEQEVTWVMHDGSIRRRDVYIPSEYLSLSQVRLEYPMPGMVPDVICIAQSSRNPSKSFELLIEVAVTHRVGAAKKALIIAQSVGCVEIDPTQMGSHQRRMTVDQLQAAVINNVQGKSWIFNPALSQLVKAAKLDLEQLDKKQHKAWQLVEERNQWLDDCSTERLVEMLLPVLEAHWGSDRPLIVEDDYEVLPKDITARLAKRGFNGVDDPLLLANDGILGCIEDIRNRHLSMRPLGRRGGLWRFNQEPALQKYVTLGLIALKTYPLTLSFEDEQRVNDLRNKVNDSLAIDERAYARPATHDKIIGMLYPPMHNRISKPHGTLKALQDGIAALRAIEMTAAADLRREADLAQKRSRDQQEKESNRRGRISELLIRESAHEWTTTTPVDTIELILKTTGVVRLSGKYARSGMDVDAILKSA